MKGDRVHLQQVLLNLILNGMDALNGTTQNDRRVTVCARLDGAQSLEIAVSDTGLGIPADELARVFEPFFTTKPHGMGMGLPISRTIIEAHGGRLWAENNNGGGATFRFTLRAAKEPRRDMSTAAPTVHIVDDDASFSPRLRGCCVQAGLR